MEISETLHGITPDINPTGSREQGDVSDKDVSSLLQQIQKNTYNSPGRPPFISQENIEHELRIFGFPNNSEFAESIRKNAVETNAVIMDLKNVLWGVGEELLISEPRKGNSVSEKSYYAAYGINLLADVLNKTGNDELSYIRRLDKESKIRSKLSGDSDTVYIFELDRSRKSRKPGFIRWFIRPNTYRGEFISENGSVVKDVREARARLDVFSPELPYKSVSLRIDSPLRYGGSIFEFDIVIGKDQSNILDEIHLSATDQQVGHHFAGRVHDPDINPQPPNVYETIATKIMHNTNP